MPITSLSLLIASTDSIIPATETTDSVNQVDGIDAAQAATIVQHLETRSRRRASATLLRVVRGLCSTLFYAAPKSPRTSRIVLDLLECSTRWASQGWDNAILFCVYLTYARSKIFRELGETTTAIGWCKNSLQMIDEHQAKIAGLVSQDDAEDTATNNNNSVEEQMDSFAELDFALGILQYRLEAMASIALYLDYPLARYKEAQKSFEDLLRVVESHLGIFLLSFHFHINCLLLQEVRHFHLQVKNLKKCKFSGRKRQ